MKKSVLLFCTMGMTLVSTCWAIDPIPANVNLLTDGSPALFDLIVSTSPESDPTGDSYSAAPLVQDGAGAFFISDVAPAALTFGTTESGGVNLTGIADSTFEVIEGFLLGAGPNGGDVILSQYTALDAAGAPTPWVAAGVVGPNGPFTSWRLDVGTTAGGTDKIANTDTVLSSGFTGFDSLGGSVGTFALTLDDSDAAGVSGLGVVGLGGADIAGFDLATVQVFWEVAPVPEPASMGLLTLGGLLSLAIVRRRR